MYNFHRQKPILNYIVDFYSSRLKLAIELDGDSHFEQAKYDNERTIQLNQYGIKVIRYYNDEILKSLEWVYNNILIKIKKRERELKSPKPPLSRGQN